MANPEHLKILKQGVEVWNKWRMENPYILPSLSGISLNGIDFRGAIFTDTHLGNSDLIGADLRDAIFDGADLTSSNLTDAKLSDAELGWANLVDVDLTGANFEKAKFNDTLIAECLTLSKAKNLDKVIHGGSSYLDIKTLRACVNELPYSFLQGVGYTNEEIELLKAQYSTPIKYYSCFISYSSKDIEFVEDLHLKIRDANVPTWRDAEDLKIGDKLRDKINEQIRIYDKLLIVLSKNSVNSSWVKYEVETGLNREIKENKIILFPIRLDDSIFDVNESWAIDIQSRHIGDFKNWENRKEYKKSLDRLIKDLKAD